ncbi:MAG: hypothetical protein LBC82_07325 [Oscillospiraceae bacterium]|jgi:bacterioferritin (cytochrome b1)|nr:hypothetical protein [Oscillospiraceae bacterium]
MYNPPTKEYIDSQLTKFNEIITYLANRYKIAKNEFMVSKDLLIKISKRLHQREDYYQHFHNKKLAQIRRAGIAAYWILKYSPLRAIHPDKKYDINAYFAYYFMLSAAVSESAAEATVESSKKIKEAITNEFEDNFLRSLSEYDISKEAFMLIAECMALVVKQAMK